MEGTPHTEKILVHEGVQLFRESQWLKKNDQSGIKIFLLVGLRDKEIMATLQVQQDSII